jgi:hypothetical protein
MLRIKTYITLILSIFTVQSFAQETVLGEWRDHLPFNNCVSVTQSGSIRYAATEFAVFSYDLSDNSIEKLSKANALSDIGIKTIRYSDATSTLIVAYKNGNLDLVSGSTTINLAFIKNDDDIIGDKTIYHIHCDGNLAYLSCAFGIVVVDIDREEIKDTYLIGANAANLQVNAVATTSTEIYAAAEDGLYKASLSNQFLNDFNQWTRLTDIPNDNGPFNQVLEFNNMIFANYNSSVWAGDTLYYLQSGNWTKFTALDPVDNLALEKCNDKLVVTHHFSVDYYDTNLNQEGFVYTYGNLDETPSPLQAIVDAQDRFWIADFELGLITATYSQDDQLILPNGPGSNATFEISISEGDVWIVAGGINGGVGSAWNNQYNRRGLSSYIDGQWRVYNRYVNHSDSTIFLNDSIFDFMSIAINPGDKSQVFAGSFSLHGLYEFRNDEFYTNYTHTNSSLQDRSPAWVSWVGVAGLWYDEDDNLWASNSFTNEPLSVRMTDGTWKSFYCGATISGKLCTDIIVDQRGYKWITAPGRGFLVYNDNETILSSSDDEYKLLTASSGNGNLPSNDVYCLAEDLDGKIWVGSSEGIAVFHNAANIFNGNNFDASQILIDQDGNVEVLLETEVITCITVDGANRKWIGTEGSGVFLVSGNGKELVSHFTEANSPLFSDVIKDIAVDHESGEVWIGTDEGLLSYRGTATLGGKTYSDDVYAYPNPVRESYNGPIAIKGLMRDSDVRITDVTGNVVYITQSEGGQAIWNGTDLNGERAKTGVYLVFCTDPEGQQTAVTKILLVN